VHAAPIDSEISLRGDRLQPRHRGTGMNDPSSRLVEIELGVLERQSRFIVGTMRKPGGGELEEAITICEQRSHTEECLRDSQ